MNGHRSLPNDVLQLLQSARYLHLATADADATPSVSLMNYTFVEEQGEPMVILTTPADTTKYANVARNPKVSLLVHGFGTPRSVSRGQAAEDSSLTQLLANLNQSAVASLSATLDGRARILHAGEQAQHYKQLHCANNPTGQGCYIDSPAIKVILVQISGCRISDPQNHVERWGKGDA